MIIFQEVTKSYGPDDFALKEVSFHVEPGELVFITGASGSGKTTLMRMLTKETNPTTGEILFADTPLSTIKASNVHHHRRKIGVVFQDYRLLPELNVWENVALPLFVAGKKDSEVEERVTDLLRLVQLTHKADLFPSQLSGGEAQRISIARALASGPEVIFADEPTGNLDAETGKHIADLLIKINELGTTVLFATHDQRFLEAFPKHHRLHLEMGVLIRDSAVAATPKTGRSEEKTTANKKSDQNEQDETEQEAADDAENTAAKETTEKTPVDDTIEKTDDEITTPQASPPKRSFWQRLFGKKPKSESAHKALEHGQMEDESDLTKDESDPTADDILADDTPDADPADGAKKADLRSSKSKSSAIHDDEKPAHTSKSPNKQKSKKKTAVASPAASQETESTDEDEKPTPVAIKTENLE